MEAHRIVQLENWTYQDQMSVDEDLLSKPGLAYLEVMSVLLFFIANPPWCDELGSLEHLGLSWKTSERCGEGRTHFAVSVSDVVLRLHQLQNCLESDQNRWWSGCDFTWGQRMTNCTEQEGHDGRAEPGMVWVGRCHLRRCDGVKMRSSWLESV